MEKRVFVLNVVALVFVVATGILSSYTLENFMRGNVKVAAFFMSLTVQAFGLFLYCMVANLISVIMATSQKEVEEVDH